MAIFQDAQTDSASLAKLVNEDADVTTRYGAQPKKSIPKVLREFEEVGDAAIESFNQEGAESIAEFDQVIDQYKESRGFNTKGTFAAGFTYELPNDVGLDASGNPWILIDTSSLPVTVTAGTTPTNPPYRQVAYGTAAQVSTNTSDTAQSFIDSFALKIFQSPTDGLTEINTRTLLGGDVYEVRKTSDDSLATIYSDESGATEIVQNGTSNVSGSDGVVDFYIADGDYYVVVGGVQSILRVLGGSKLAGHYTLLEVQATSFDLGQRVTLTNLGNAMYEVVSASDTDGFYIHTFGGGDKLKLLDKHDSLKFAWFGCFLDGDNSEAFNNAIDYADGRLIEGSSDGVITIEQNLTLNPLSVNIDMQGSVFDMSSGGSIKLTVEPTLISDLVSSISGGENAAQFVSAHGLSKGDVFAVYNPTDYSFASFRDYYRDGCMFKVSKIFSPTAVRFYGLSPSLFLANSVECYKLNGSFCIIKNLNILPPVSGISFWIDGYSKVELEDYTVSDGSADTALEIQRCYNINVSAGDSTASLSDAYPIVFSNSQRIKFTGSNNRSTRHVLAFGGRDDAPAVPCRDIIVSDSILTNDSEDGAGSADVHGNVQNISYNDCDINVANIAGKDVRYNNCKIYGRVPTYNPDGNAIFGSEVVGGVFEFNNCTLETWGDNASFGAFYAEVSNLSEDVYFIFDNLTIVNKGASSTNRLIQLNVGDTSPNPNNVSVSVSKLKYISSQPAFSCFSITGANDVSGNLTVSLAELEAPTGSKLMVSTNTGNYQCKLRLPTQVKSVILSTSTSANIATSGLLNFDYPYPQDRVPEQLVSVGSPDGNVKAANSAGSITTAWVFAYTNTYTRASIASGDGQNWTSIQDFKVWVSSKISD